MFKQLRFLIFKGPPVGNGAAPKPTMIEFPTKVSAEGVKDFDVSSNIDDD